MTPRLGVNGKLDTEYSEKKKKKHVYITKLNLLKVLCFF